MTYSSIFQAFVRVLLDSGDRMLNEDIRQRTADEYDRSTAAVERYPDSLRFTRKYPEEFTYSLVEYQWVGDQMQYRLNPDSGYIEELRERLVRSADESCFRLGLVS